MFEFFENNFRKRKYTDIFLKEYKYIAELKSHYWQKKKHFSEQKNKLVHFSCLRVLIFGKISLKPSKTFLNRVFSKKSWVA